ncbi:MAG: serine hydrolase domain-containing protein [Rhodospirillaceae bacterium]
MKHFRFFVLIFVLAFSGAVQAADATAERLDAAVKAHPDFSGVIVVADNGKPIFEATRGQRNFVTGTAMTQDAIFELASITKQFTAMGVMLLKEEGKLSYDDPLEKFVPGLPYPGITVRHLLNHTSGFPDYEEMMDAHWDKTKVATNKDITAYLKQYKPAARSKPGEKYEYSNGGYVMLGSVIEAASGQDYATFLRTRIFKPLGLRDTDVRPPQEWDKNPRFALGHVVDKETNKPVRAIDLKEVTYVVYLGGRVGPGRISSTAADLLTWDRALRTEKLLKHATLAEAFKPATLNDGKPSAYGFGWMIPERDSVLGDAVTHTGGNPGISNRITRFLDRDMTVIILSNNAYKNSNALYEGILSAVRGPQG